MSAYSLQGGGSKFIMCPAGSSYLHPALILERARLGGIAVSCPEPGSAAGPGYLCNGHIPPCLPWGHLSKQGLGIPGLRGPSGSPGERSDHGLTSVLGLVLITGCFGHSLLETECLWLCEQRALQSSDNIDPFLVQQRLIESHCWAEGWVGFCYVLE